MGEWEGGGNERMREWARKENEGMGMGRRDRKARGLGMEIKE